MDTTASGILSVASGASLRQSRSMQAFDLYPQPTVAGRVGRIDAFRDDALELQLARLLMEGRARPR